MRPYAGLESSVLAEGSNEAVLAEVRAASSCRLAAARREGMSYSEFIHGLDEAGVEVNRKMLADIAVRDPEAFRRFAELAREAIAA